MDFNTDHDPNVEKDRESRNITDEQRYDQYVTRDYEHRLMTNDVAMVKENRNIVRYVLMTIAFFVVVGAVFLLYRFFAVTPQAKLLNGYHNLIKRVDSDYEKMQKKLGFTQDFSKESHAVFTLENIEKGRFGQLLEGIESLSVHLIQSDKHRLYQFLVTAKKPDGIYDLFGLQIDEKKVSIAYPEINNKVYTLSAKEFGKEFNEVSKNLRLYYSQFSKVDLSYSSLRKMLKEKYDRNRILERYLSFFQELFQDVKIKQTGDTYSCLIAPENFERALDNALNQAIKDFEEIDLYNSKGFLEILKFSLLNELKDYGLLLETKLSDGLAKEFEMKILYFNDEIGRVKFRTNAQRNENIFKDMELEFYNVDFDESIRIHNALEEKDDGLIDTISVKSNIVEPSQSNLVFSFKNPNSLNNFKFQIETFLNGEYQSSLEMKGDYKTQSDSFSFLIPFITFDDPDFRKMDVPLGIRYEVKKDTSDRRNIEKDRVEVRMVDMKKEDFEELLDEIEEFDEKMKRINKI